MELNPPVKIVLETNCCSALRAILGPIMGLTMGVSDICWWSGVAGMCTVYMNSELTSPATSDSSSRDNEIYLPLEVLLPVEDGEFDFSWCGLPSPPVIKLRKLLPPVMDSDEAAGDPICRYSILRSQRARDK
jgi:hypothetical protein